MPNAPANTTTQPAHGFDPGAGVLAFLLPGMGYVVRGERTRAVYFIIGIAMLLVMGVFIGGLDVVDRVNDRWWFIAQAGVGPIAWGLDWLRANQGGALVSSIGRANEIGTLFIVLAGMCNAIAVIDCLLPTIRDDEAEAGTGGNG